MKKSSLVALAVLVAAHPAFGSLLFHDNFTAADGRLNDSFSNPPTLPMPGRTSGSVAADTLLTSHRAHQLISSNQLSGVGTAGFRFENPSLLGAGDRYDWAAGAASGDILSVGGFTVSFDWIAPTSGDLTQWIAWAVGTNNADSGASVVNEAANDYGVLFRVNGGTERFDNGANLGAGGTFDVSSNVHSVAITYEFDSWADGTNVTATSVVDGTQVASDTFQWDSNGGAFHMEFATNNTGSLIDNLAVNTIPEPSAVALVALAGLGLLGRRRR